METAIIIGVVILVLLNIADIMTTIEILFHGGVEKNPFVDYAIKKMGAKTGLIAIKVVGILPFCAIAILKPGVIMLAMIIGFCLLYAGVVWHNLKQIKE